MIVYAFTLLDTSGRVMSWNKGAQQTYGYTSEEIIGHHISQFIPKDEPEQQRQPGIVDLCGYIIKFQPDRQPYYIPTHIILCILL